MLEKLGEHEWAEEARARAAEKAESLMIRERDVVGVLTDQAKERGRADEDGQGGLDAPAR